MEGSAAILQSESYSMHLAAILLPVAYQNLDLSIPTGIVGIGLGNHGLGAVIASAGSLRLVGSFGDHGFRTIITIIGPNQVNVHWRGGGPAARQHPVQVVVHLGPAHKLPAQVCHIQTVSLHRVCATIRIRAAALEKPTDIP